LNEEHKKEVQSLEKQVSQLTMSTQKGEMAMSELNEYKQTFAQLFDQGVIDH
jgi:hypothetical protein